MLSASRPSLDSLDIRAVFEAISYLAHHARSEIDASPTSPAAEVFSHLGCAPDDIVTVQSSLPGWHHVTAVRAIDAYVETHPSASPWWSVSGDMRAHQDIVTVLTKCHARGPYSAAAVQYRSVDTGPDTTESLPVFGLRTTTSPDGHPVAVLLRGPGESGSDKVTVTVLAADSDCATTTSQAITESLPEHDVLRGKILTLGQKQNRGNELVGFLPKPNVDASDLILPDGTAERLYRHIVAVGAHAAELRAAGQHVKRGVLLYGPPGTGKTHTVRYLLGSLTGTTAVVLSGSSLQYIGTAAALARELQPAVVVVEDVDLIAGERSSHSSSPLLFTLLDAMDGISADADITFVLTTNRPEVIERAVRDRPGRIDLAVEVPLPDAEGRRRLVELYTADVTVTADIGPIVDATEGATASYVRELVRRAVLASLTSGAEDVGEEHVRAAVDGLSEERGELTRSLLGA
ncbi:AAA family ATPase [Rhodococcoides trifolii]|uniref:AAA family ATPase n=1 Tax=Rhodococcoides trifolii TaxID=908250 RepID=UPI0016666ECC|nr:ATP-binding protein [Rhodococcus trifolii]